MLKSEVDLRILAIANLELASKYDELDERIPFVNDILYVYALFLGNKTLNDVINLERKILFALNFDLMVVTPLHFTYLFIA